MRELGEVGGWDGGVVLIAVLVVVASKSSLPLKLSLVLLLVGDVSYSFDNNGTVLGVVASSSSSNISNLELF